MRKLKQLFVAALLFCCLVSHRHIYAQGGIVFDWAIPGIVDSGQSSQLHTFGVDVTVDNAGNVYNIGSLGRSVNWGGISLIPSTYNAFGNFNLNPFITKSDAAGNVIWAKTFPSAVPNLRASFRGRAIIADNKGHLYAGLTFQDTISIGGFGFTTNRRTGTSSSIDALIVKLDTAGNVIWVRQIWTTPTTGGTNQTRAEIYELNVDEEGNVYAVGEFRGVAAFDTTYLRGSIHNANSEVFMTKLDADGNFKWAKGAFSLLGNQTPTGTCIVPDNSGNLYVHGRMRDSLRVQNATLRGTIGSAYVLKLNADNGNLVWSKVIATEPVMIDWSSWGMGIFAADPISPGKMTYDGIGNVIVTGSFFGKVDFNPGTDPADTFYLMRAADNNANAYLASGGAFVLKLDSSGKFVWAKAFQSVREGGATIRGVKTDQYGHIYTTGQIEPRWLSYDAGIDFDPGPDSFIVIRASDRIATYITKLDNEGNLRWAKVFGATTGDSSGVHSVIAQAIAVTQEGKDIYTTGGFESSGNIDFDPGPDSFIISLKKMDASPFLHKLICTVDSNGATIDTTTDCRGLTFNGETFTTEGLHYTAIPNWSGCDSIVKVNLSFIRPEPEITIDVDTLSTTQSYTSYQWLKDGEIIQGATNRNYTVSENGNYQVIVTDETGCTDTSEVYPVTNKDIHIEAVAASSIRVFPNPAESMLYIESPVAVHAALTGLDGRILLSGSKEAVSHRISVKELASGIYFLNIRNNKGNLIRVEKVVKR